MIHGRAILLRTAFDTAQRLFGQQRILGPAPMSFCECRRQDWWICAVNARTWKIDSDIYWRWLVGPRRNRAISNSAYTHTKKMAVPLIIIYGCCEDIVEIWVVCRVGGRGTWRARRIYHGAISACRPLLSYRTATSSKYKGNRKSAGCWPSTRID